MNRNAFCVFGLKTDLLHPGDDVVSHLAAACAETEYGGFQDGDIIVVAESPLATAEGRVVAISSVEPSEQADRLGAEYGIDPRLVQIVLDESDRVVGGIPGFLLCLKNGTLLPNAGVDASNAPPGSVVLLPVDPDASAARIRAGIRERCAAEVGVIVADSRTHAMRLGSSGVAIGCSGLLSAIDECGRTDLFGRELHVTKRAVADCLASAAELVMGEADECVPGAVIRGSGLPIGDYSGVAAIDASECLFMGTALHAHPSLLDRKSEPEPL
ncbi:coenzyme F420-0:L-glutamate ligase [Methanoculleus sp. FWC-SCC1]|uniref:Coenzyme F420-0:L-glutamate ligase n=1 Tax=Methanoculleus frigidifontis TaxID=2584085 RepID=A0ABT8MCI2_9EURY|nr:coenzyme F420-0:L-glutamate ligase [Methanoculleus sp. FWC-SCC1]MDN7025641.1 coenzyme F420-0:L-glutamate ligase [Methanoculleus sp. FWC-SCC1]